MTLTGTHGLLIAICHGSTAWLGSQNDTLPAHTVCLLLSVTEPQPG